MQRVLVIVVAGLVAIGVISPAAADTATCTYDAGTRTANVTVVDEGQGATDVFQSGGVIHTVGVPNPCGGATVMNTDTLVIGAAPTGREFIYVVPDFVPGFTDEPGSSDEIEITADLGGKRDVLGVDSLHSADTLAPRTFVFGGKQINLNAGEADGVDADVSLAEIEEVIAYGANGADTITGVGGAGTPSKPASVDLYLIGGGGNDVLVGGNGFDELSGGDGDDVLRHSDGLGFGGAGNDRISAGEGDDDNLEGGTGDDRMRGGGGDDHLNGGPGKDVLVGGSGFDVCVGGTGKDTFKGCEVKKG